MIGARFGALALALVLVFTGCSKPSRNLLSPESGAPGHRLAGSASYRIPARIDPDTTTLAFGRSLSVHAFLDAVIPASPDTTRSRVFRWVGEPGWIAVDSSVTRLPLTTMYVTGPRDERTLSTSLQLFVVDTVRYFHPDTSVVPGTTRDTVTYTPVTVIDTVATARVGVGLIRRARPDVASVDVTFESPSDTLIFGAGINVRAQARTSSGAATSEAGWHYYWSSEPEIIQLAAPAVAGDPRSSLVLLGSNDLNIKSMQVRATVVRDDTVWTRLPDKWAYSLEAMDTLATGFRSVIFKRAVNRDVTADFWVYHVTKALGGSIAASEDSAVARFVNNDADHNLLRAGALSVSGTGLLERHLPVGQHYSGPILFRIPGAFEIHNTGPASDGNSHVPQLNFATQGPPNELTLTYPDNRSQIRRDHELDIQWSGGLGSSLVSIRVEQPAIGRRDTVRVGVGLQVRLTDSSGKRFLVQTLDSGRFTMSAAQLGTMSPGLVEVVLTRQINVPVLTVAAATEVNSTVHMIEENHSWFFLK